jgi:hypothetical protein
LGPRVTRNKAFSFGSGPKCESNVLYPSAEVRAMKIQRAFVAGMISTLVEYLHGNVEELTIGDFELHTFVALSPQCFDSLHDSAFAHRRCLDVTVCAFSSRFIP